MAVRHPRWVTLHSTHPTETSPSIDPVENRPLHAAPNEPIGHLGLRMFVIVRLHERHFPSGRGSPPHRPGRKPAVARRAKRTHWSSKVEDVHHCSIARASLHIGKGIWPRWRRSRRGGHVAGCHGFRPRTPCVSTSATPRTGSEIGARGTHKSLPPPPLAIPRTPSPPTSMMTISQPRAIVPHAAFSQRKKYQCPTPTPSGKPIAATPPRAPAPKPPKARPPPRKTPSNTASPPPKSCSRMKNATPTTRASKPGSTTTSPPTPDTSPPSNDSCTPKTDSIAVHVMKPNPPGNASSTPSTASTPTHSPPPTNSADA